MLVAPHPDNEHERLAELDRYELDGVFGQEDFDFLTAMAADICGTPKALVSMILADKQQFLSNFGGTDREAPLDTAFCTHAILEPDDVLEVRDARLDPRFADNPVVLADSPVVFYAGVPLVNDKGFPLGTLCVVAHEPKELSTAQRTGLVNLARQAMRILDLRRLTHDRRQANAQLRRIISIHEQTQSITKVGSWCLDVDTGALEWSPELYAIHELPHGHTVDVEFALSFYSEQDQPRFRQAVAALIDEGSAFDLTGRIRTHLGGSRWVRATGKKVGTHILGAFQDITTAKDEEAERQTLLEQSQEQNARLRQFAHIVSHNLRSHANGIRGLTEIVAQQHSNIATDQAFTLLEQSAEHLQNTITDLTEVVSVELGHHQPGPVRLLDTVKGNLNAVSCGFIHEDIALTVQVPTDAQVMGVRAFVNSIVLNLLTNAVKYRHPQRTADIRIYADRDHDHWALHVEDNGLGIDLDRFGARLFSLYQTFHQHPDARGVGLFISKSQAEAKGGKLLVRSQPGEGSRFSLLLPAQS